MISLILSFAMAGDAADLDRATWTDVAVRDDVTLRRAVVDDVRCIEGVLETPATSDALVAVTDRMVTSPDWSDATLSHSEELARDDDGFVLHQHFNSPGWTLSADRYWIVRGEPVRHSDTHSRYRWSRVPAEDYPEAEATSQALSRNAIEMPTNYGEWDFQQHDHTTIVRYRACADIGGGAPTAVVSWLTTRQVPTLIHELVDEALRSSP